MKKRIWLRRGCQIRVNTSITSLIILISIYGAVYAENYSSSELVHITFKDSDGVTGTLEKANDEFVLVHDPEEDALLLIPRIDILLVEMEHDQDCKKFDSMNLYQDVIEFVDGRKIQCHILDMNNDYVSYCMSSGRLTRNAVRFNNIKSVYFHGSSITIPYPALSVF